MEGFCSVLIQEFNSLLQLCPAYNGIINEFIRVNADKTISLTRCCSVSGLGPDKSPHRDGSFEYYMSEPIRDNDAKGVGPFIWASLEMEQMGYNTDSFSK